MKREILTMSDGKKLSLAVWETKNAKAVVQISHGMSEHIARYDEFALALNEAGFAVIGDDHRAHGLTDENRLGLAEDGRDLFADTVNDMSQVTDYAKDKFGLPVILFGHSYGSFLSQEYILKYSDKIVACILSGSALYSGFVSGFGKTVANMKAKKHADDAGNFFAKITFDGYDKKIKAGKNGWLSTNMESNEKYNNDALCGFTCSNGFYKYFFTHLKSLSSDSFDSIRKDLPLFVIYGSQDYVGSCGKLITPLVNKYVKAGLTVEEKKYEGMRHELTNETDRSVVFEDVIEFCENVISEKWKEIEREISDEE